MKTLSVRQPWACLICSGYKDVENRSRRTNYRGKILIHSPAKSHRGVPHLNCEQFMAVNKGPFGSVIGEDCRSAIIGSVEIIDCINDSSSIWAEPGQWHWILSNPVLFDKPILNIPGRLGLWNYDGMKA